MTHESAAGPRQEPGGKPRTAKAGSGGLVLVCAKCAKRQGYRKGEASRRLKRALRDRPGGGKARIVETRCLGPCPKRLLTLATPDSLSRGRLLLVDPALPEAEVSALVPDLRPKARLGPSTDMRYRSRSETDATREDA